MLLVNSWSGPVDSEPMNQSKRFLAIAALLFSGAFCVGFAEDQQTIDTTAQEMRPPRGRGPFPGSASSGHSAGLPIRLELLIPTGELQPDGTTRVDFIITNIGTEPIKLPSSVALFNFEPREQLTLWVTSDAIKDQYLGETGSGRLVLVKMKGVVSISAELDGTSDDPRSLYVLPPNKSIRVHASSPQLKSGTHSLTAHAELLRVSRVSNGSSEVITSEGIGTADSDVVTTRLSTPSPTSR
jgi:hypothetical protein